MFKNILFALAVLLAPFYAQSATQFCNYNSCAEAPNFTSNYTPYIKHQPFLPAFFTTKTPYYIGLSKYAIIAKIHFGDMSIRTVSGNTVTLTDRAPDTTLVYSPIGWVGIDSCGSTPAQITSNCGWLENTELNLLNGELVFQELTLDTNLVISYIRTINQDLTHQGNLYQCTQFFSREFPSCFYL